MSPNITTRRSGQTQTEKRRSSGRGHTEVITRRTSGEGVQAELTVSISLTADDTKNSSQLTNESDLLSPIEESPDTTVIEVKNDDISKDSEESSSIPEEDEQEEL